MRNINFRNSRPKLNRDSKIARFENSHLISGEIVSEIFSSVHDLAKRILFLNSLSRRFPHFTLQLNSNYYVQRNVVIVTLLYHYNGFINVIKSPYFFFFSSFFFLSINYNSISLSGAQGLATAAAVYDRRFPVVNSFSR